MVLQFANPLPAVAAPILVLDGVPTAPVLIQLRAWRSMEDSPGPWGPTPTWESQGELPLWCQISSALAHVAT